MELLDELRNLNNQILKLGEEWKLITKYFEIVRIFIYKFINFAENIGDNMVGLFSIYVKNKSYINFYLFLFVVFYNIYNG